VLNLIPKFLAASLISSGVNANCSTIGVCGLLGVRGNAEAEEGEDTDEESSED
jgi:hypothetical protein